MPKNYMLSFGNIGMELNKAFGEALRLTRRATKISQEELAEALNIQQSAISRLERGLVSPTLETIDRIASRLGTTSSALILQTEQIRSYADSLKKVQSRSPKKG